MTRANGVATLRRVLFQMAAQGQLVVLHCGACSAEYFADPRSETLIVGSQCRNCWIGTLRVFPVQRILKRLNAGGAK